MYGDSLLELAKVADQEADKYPEISIFVTAPYVDISTIANQTKNIIVTAQHIDGIQPEEVWGPCYQPQLKI